MASLPPHLRAQVDPLLKKGPLDRPAGFSRPTGIPSVDQVTYGVVDSTRPQKTLTVSDAPLSSGATFAEVFDDRAPQASVFEGAEEDPLAPSVISSSGCLLFPLLLGGALLWAI